MSKLPTNAVGVEYTYDEIMAKGKKRREAKKAASEYKDAFGEGSVERGEVNLNVETREGRKNRKNMVDLMQPVWRAEAEDARMATSKVAVERLYDDAGRHVDVASALAPEIARRKGLHATRGRLTFGPPAGGWPQFKKKASE